MGDSEMLLKTAPRGCPRSSSIIAKACHPAPCTHLFRKALHCMALAHAADQARGSTAGQSIAARGWAVSMC